LSGEYDYLFKIIVTGDGGVGKTAITVRFSQGKFDSNYKMTIGVDFAIKMLEIDNRKVKLQIWDTGGQERFSYIRPLYYKGAMGNILIFDLTNRSSYDHLDRWYGEVLQNCGEIPSILVGNKSDLPDRAVSTNEAQTWASSHGMIYYECSAKTGEKVGDIFAELTRVLISGPIEHVAPGASIISTTPPSTPTPSPRPTATAPSFTSPPPKPAATTPSFTSPPPKPAATTPSFTSPPPRPAATTPSFTSPPPRPAATTPSFTSPPPKPAAIKPSFTSPSPKPVTPTFTSPSPKPTATPYAQPTPSIRKEPEVQPAPQPRITVQPQQLPSQPQPIQPSYSTPTEKDETLDEALKLLDIEDTTTAPSTEPIPIADNLEPQPLEIPEIEEPIPIDNNQISIDNIEPIPIDNNQISIDNIEPIPIDNNQISIDNIEPIPIEEPTPIMIEETQPISINNISKPIPIENSPQVSETKSDFIPFQPSSEPEPEKLAIDDIQPIEVLDEEIPIELPSPESVLENVSQEVETTQDTQEESIFGISSSKASSAEPAFTPFTSSESAASEPSQPVSVPDEVESVDLFATLSQKKKTLQTIKKAPRFVPFIPTSDGEYEDITLEVVRKDEKEIESTNMIKCPGCKRDIPANWKFCTYCGTIIR